MSLKEKISTLFRSGRDREEILSELEELLILADISVDLVMEIMEKVQQKSGLIFNEGKFIGLLKAELTAIFHRTAPSELSLKPGKNVIMVVGVNGSGKTTQVAKLGYYFQKRGKKVLFCASDTFRAAGGTQLSLWGERLDIAVIGGDRGADPGSVVYNSLSALKSRDRELLIIDTAGRVQTSESLMRELRKLSHIVNKFYPGQPAEVLMVVDATMGQNTLEQARRFKEFSGLSGLLLAKMDGSAKGGSIVNIVHEMGLPVKFAGIGETETDLKSFDPPEFVEDLLSR